MATELAESGSRRPRRSYLCRAVEGLLANVREAVEGCLAVAVGESERCHLGRPRLIRRVL